MQFRRAVRHRLLVEKKDAFRKQSKKRKRKRGAANIPANIPAKAITADGFILVTPVNETIQEGNPIMALSQWQGGADPGDNERCRMCGKKLRGAMQCRGCDGQICKKCSELEQKEWRKKDNPIFMHWICKACDSLLINIETDEVEQ